MSGSAKIAENNPVYLADGKTITLGGNLTQTVAAVIAVPTYTVGLPVLTGSSFLSANCGKFKVYDGYPVAKFSVDSAGKLKKMYTTVSFTISPWDILYFENATTVVGKSGLVTVAVTNPSSLSLTDWTIRSVDYLGVRETIYLSSYGPYQFYAPDAVGVYDITVAMKINGKTYSGSFKLAVRP
jgi:hypothetical protein